MAALRGFDRAVAPPAQLGDRLDDPAGPLGDRGRLAGERGSRGQLGIDRIALAHASARVRMGLVDLEHPLRAQIPNQPGRVAAGRLDADHGELAEARQPAKELGVAVHGRRKALRAEQRAALIQSGGMVAIGVRIYSANNERLLVLHPVPAVLSIREGGPVGKGGHNSDEALVASRFLSGHAARPDRPDGRSAAASPKPTGPHERHQQGQFMRRSDPRPDARPHLHCLRDSRVSRTLKEVSCRRHRS